MTEAEYQHECSRAELLGIPKPTWEEFLSTRSEAPRAADGEEEEEAPGPAEEAEARREGFRRLGGGLDELNSLLSTTQKKLNRFKTVCGSFSNILKLHIGTKKEDQEGDGSSEGQDDLEKVDTITVEQTEDEGRKMKSDSPHHCTKGDAHSALDKLDSLIGKAERAELSLSSQNKQIKKFLN